MRCPILAVLMFFYITCSAQRDAYWFFGDSAGIHFTNNTTVPITGAVVSDEGSTVVSDLNGNLLFYAGSKFFSGNYGAIYNRNHQIMQGGDSLKTFASFTQGIFIVPFVSDTNKYYVFYQDGGRSGYPKVGFYYSIVDLSFNLGLGAVFQKNTLVDTISRSEKRVLVKHANGRDWWIICHPQDNDLYIKYLIVNDSLTGPFFQNIGSVIHVDNGGKMSISPDGKYLVTPCQSGALDLFDFDRCSGMLSNWRYLGDSNVNPWGFDRYFGTCFSNNNLLYVATFDSIWQFDAKSNNPSTTKQFLFADNNPNSGIGQMQKGPDDKIYFCSAGAINGVWPPAIVDSLSQHLSVIEQPDSLGLSCNLVPYSVSLGSRWCLLGLPFMPNYELGADSASICDTLSTGLNYITQLEKSLLLYPNPVIDELTIVSPDYLIQLVEVYNLYGELIFSDSNSISHTQKINMSNFMQGIYFVKLTTSRGVVTKKILKW